ncbi:hypothetical protein EBU71_18215 [bacterium]|nr:hypothetical protein [Candidatus Elulimicrobium humile]
MKEIQLQNIFNKEILRCDNLKDIEVIDGVEYLRVKKDDKGKKFLMRRDSLKKLPAARAGKPS